ncbi:MAG: imidazole glycerol phosphate synthase subunit HisF [Deltaproteobacteria bacterium]|nr:imidazole glycerol phosphate synthase subunit HisF [Deltaproteobacteria bacterium]
MKRVRIIPRLDIKGPNLVKGVHMEGLRVLGRPEVFAPRYYEDGADELIYIDSVASLYGRNNLEEIVKRTAEKVFIPLTVGGGVKGIEDIRRLLRAGADKVAINTAAIKNPSLIREASLVFGSQCIVVSIQAKARGNGRYECLTDNARERSGKDVFEWADEAQRQGAGEILLTSVDRDGTGRGFDIGLIELVALIVNIPLIVSGGAGSMDDALCAARAGADAVCLASIFHYHVLDSIEDEAGFEEGNIDFLKKQLPIENRSRRRIKPVSIRGLKDYLKAKDIWTRTQVSCEGAYG